jgi:hypothetical protein
MHSTDGLHARQQSLPLLDTDGAYPNDDQTTQWCAGYNGSKSKENMKKVVAAASTISLPPLSVIAAAGDDFRFSLSHLCSPVRFQTTLDRLAAAFTAEGDYTALLLIL